MRNSIQKPGPKARAAGREAKSIIGKSHKAKSPSFMSKSNAPALTPGKSTLEPK